MLKILRARLQQYVNCELPDVQAGFRKGRGTRDQIANIQGIIKKASESESEVSRVRPLATPWTAGYRAPAFMGFSRQECWNGLPYQKNIYFCFIDYAKAFDCVDHNKLWKILKDGNTRLPDLPLEKPVCRSGSNSLYWT